MRILYGSRPKIQKYYVLSDSYVFNSCLNDFKIKYVRIWRRSILWFAYKAIKLGVKTMLIEEDGINNAIEKEDDLDVYKWKKYTIYSWTNRKRKK